jgi:Cu/Zn superoxide dismutase
MGKQSKPEERTSLRNEVSTAEQTVERLQEQREQLVAERQKAEAETSRHAFAAHARGDCQNQTETRPDGTVHSNEYWSRC